MSTAAPEGTGWARAARAFAREVESGTGGDVKVKWYFGGITGDEVQSAERVRRDQLDGIASGGGLCARLSPSMRVGRVLGLLQGRDEARYVLGRLKPELDVEFRKSGFTNLALAGIGPDILFSRAPVRSLGDLRHGRWWTWDVDEFFAAQLPALGIASHALPLDAAARAYDAGEIAGFITSPTAALAFQWSVQARYVEELHLGFNSGCLLVADRAFDALPPSAQQVMRSAAARFATQVEELGRQQDDALLGGLFERQGLRPVAVSESFRSEFLESARTARDQLGDAVVPQAVILRVSTWLADYRADHRNRGER